MTAPESVMLVILVIMSFFVFFLLMYALPAMINSIIDEWTRFLERFRNG